jgi:hypothetical protein
VLVHGISIGGWAVVVTETMSALPCVSPGFFFSLILIDGVKFVKELVLL